MMELAPSKLFDENIGKYTSLKNRSADGLNLAHRKMAQWGYWEEYKPWEASPRQDLELQDIQ